MNIIEKIANIIFRSIQPNFYPDFTEQQKSWVGLTEAELRSCLPIAKLTGKPGIWFTTAHVMATLRAAEEKLKEKNQ